MNVDPRSTVTAMCVALNFGSQFCPRVKIGAIAWGPAVCPPASDCCVCKSGTWTRLSGFGASATVLSLCIFRFCRITTLPSQMDLFFLGHSAEENTCEDPILPQFTDHLSRGLFCSSLFLSSPNKRIVFCWMTCCPFAFGSWDNTIPNNNTVITKQWDAILPFAWKKHVFNPVISMCTWAGSRCHYMNLLTTLHNMSHSCWAQGKPAKCPPSHTQLIQSWRFLKDKVQQLDNRENSNLSLSLNGELATRFLANRSWSQLSGSSLFTMRLIPHGHN